MIHLYPAVSIASIVTALNQRISLTKFAVFDLTYDLTALCQLKFLCQKLVWIVQFCIYYLCTNILVSMIYLLAALCQFSFRQARIYLCFDSPHHSRYLAQPCCDNSVKTLFSIQAAVSIVYVLTALRHLWVCSHKLVWTVQSRIYYLCTHTLVSMIYVLTALYVNSFRHPSSQPIFGTVLLWQQSKHVPQPSSCAYGLCLWQACVNDWNFWRLLSLTYVYKSASMLVLGGTSWQQLNYAGVGVRNCRVFLCVFEGKLGK